MMLPTCAPIQRVRALRLFPRPQLEAESKEVSIWAGRERLDFRRRYFASGETELVQRVLACVGVDQPVPRRQGAAPRRALGIARPPDIRRIVGEMSSCALLAVGHERQVALEQVYGAVGTLWGTDDRATSPRRTQAPRAAQQTPACQLPPWPHATRKMRGRGLVQTARRRADTTGPAARWPPRRRQRTPGVLPPARPRSSEAPATTPRVLRRAAEGLVERPTENGAPPVRERRRRGSEGRRQRLWRRRRPVRRRAILHGRPARQSARAPGQGTAPA